MKKTYKNGFSDGLIMDLNPTITRNSVMTNALNATLITNNGNEMTLQQDMGNGRVQGAFLPKGYIPMGSCEFGGIIYIASYNPITNTSQLGSFPSPSRETGTGDNGYNVDSIAFNYFIKNLNSTVYTFTRVHSNQTIQRENFISLNYFSTEGTSECVSSSNLEKYIYTVSENETHETTSAGDGIYILNYEDYLLPLSILTNTVTEDDTTTVTTNALYVSPKELIRSHYTQVLTNEKLYPGDHFYVNCDYSGNSSESDQIQAFVYKNESDTYSLETKTLDSIQNYNTWRDFINANLSVVSNDGKIIHLYNEAWLNINDISETSNIVSENNIENAEVDNWRQQHDLSGKLQTFAGKISGKLAVDLEVKLSDTFEVSYDLYRTDAQQEKYENVYEAIYNPQTTLEKTLSELILNPKNEYSTQLSGTHFVEATADINIDFDDDSNCIGYCYIIQRDMTQMWNGKNWVKDPYSKKYGIINYHEAYFKPKSEELEKTITLDKVDRLTTVKIVPIYSFQDNPTLEYSTFEIGFNDFDIEKYYSDFVKWDNYNGMFINREQEVIVKLDPSKAEINSCELTQFKYFNTDETCALTLGLDTHTRKGYEVFEVSVTFYDDYGKAGILIFNRDNYSGVFTETFLFDSLNSQIVLTPPINYSGLETILHKYKTRIINDKSTKVTEVEDSGIIHPNLIYAVNIKVICGIRNELNEIDENTGKAYTYSSIEVLLDKWRWVWTNQLMNDFYFNVSDFELSTPTLQWNTLTQFKLNNQFISNSIDATVSDGINLDSLIGLTTSNIEAVTGVGFVNNYNTFYVNDNFYQEQDGKIIKGIPIAYYQGDCNLTYSDYSYYNEEDSDLIPELNNTILTSELAITNITNIDKDTISIQSSVNSSSSSDTTEESDDTTAVSNGNSSTLDSDTTEENISDAYPNWDDSDPHNLVVSDNPATIQPEGIKLPSGTIWYIYNLGASTISEAGDSYCFGQITKSAEGRNSEALYIWYNSDTFDTSEIPEEAYYEYYHYNEQTSSYDMEYSIVGTQYDPVTQIFGSNWHMPYKWQIEELKTCCEFDYNSDGEQYIIVNYTNDEGVTSTIYLPANDTMILSSGINVQYFSGSFEINSEYAYTLSATATNDEQTVTLGTYERYFALPIRPVYSEITTNTELTEGEDYIIYNKISSEEESEEEIEDETLSEEASNNTIAVDTTTSSKSTSSTPSANPESITYLTEDYDVKTANILFNKFWKNNSTFLKLFKTQVLTFDKFKYEYSEVSGLNIEYIRPLCMVTSEGNHSDWAKYGINYNDSETENILILDCEENNDVEHGWALPKVYSYKSETGYDIYDENATNITTHDFRNEELGNLNPDHDGDYFLKGVDDIIAPLWVKDNCTILGKFYDNGNWHGDTIQEALMGNNIPHMCNGLGNFFLLSWLDTKDQRHYLNTFVTRIRWKQYVNLLKAALNQIYYLSDTTLQQSVIMKHNYNYIQNLTRTFKLDIITQIQEFVQIYINYTQAECPLTIHGLNYTEIIDIIYENTGQKLKVLNPSNINLNISALRKTYVLPITINEQIPEVEENPRYGKLNETGFEFMSDKTFYKDVLYDENGDQISEGIPFKINMIGEHNPNNKLLYKPAGIYSGFESYKSTFGTSTSWNEVPYVYISIDHMVLSDGVLKIKPETYTPQTNDCICFGGQSTYSTPSVIPQGVIENRYFHIYDGNYYGFSLPNLTT